MNHLPPNAGPSQGQRGRKPADLNVQAGGGNSPSVNPLKSPPLRQVQSPMMGSPSGNLKSPQTPSQLAGMLTGPAGPQAPAAPPSSAPMKSPHSMMGSAGASPVHMRSPSLPNPSPGWASSPKPPMQSPGVPQQGGKPPLGLTSPNMMGNMEQGRVHQTIIIIGFVIYFFDYKSLWRIGCTSQKMHHADVGRNPRISSSLCKRPQDVTFVQPVTMPAIINLFGQSFVKITPCGA